MGEPASEIRVVCPVFNPGEGELVTFTRTLATATTRPYELVLVNNGTDARALDAIRAAHPSITVLRHPGGNVGYGRASNLGAGLGTGLGGEGRRSTSAPARRFDWLVIVNPDVEWTPGSLDALIDALADNPRAGSTGPRILNTDGTVYPSARALPSLSIGAGHAVFHRIWPGNPWSQHYRHAERAAETGQSTPVGWLSGACVVLRREAFEDVGGFDEHYFMFFEDVDLGDRLGKAGWLNLYVPTATVTHVQGTSWKTSPEPMIRAHHASAKRYLFDRWGAWWQAPVRWGLAVGLAVRQRIEIALSRRERRASP